MKKPQKKIRVSSSYPNQSEPLHNLFRFFALLNLRLHRRVKLLVLESSLLEFRVLVISCHAAAAPSSSPCHLPPLLIRHRSESVSIYHHKSVSIYHHHSVSIYHHRYHIPPPLIEANVSRCFDEMVAIVSVGVDLDDPTTNVRDV